MAVLATPPTMVANVSPGRLLHGELVYSIVGCAFEVLTTLGHGLREKPHENALVIELGFQGILVERQPRCLIDYQGFKVGDDVPDLVAAKTSLVDARIIDAISDIERGKMINYLRATKLRVSLLLNFKNPRLERERIVL